MGSSTTTPWFNATGIQAWKAAAQQYASVAENSVDAAHQSVQDHVVPAIAGVLEDHPAGGSELASQVQVFGDENQSYVGIPDGPHAQAAKGIEYGTLAHPPAAPLRQSLNLDRQNVLQTFSERAWGRQ